MAKRLQHDGLDPDTVLQFTCECSNEDCREAINLTVPQYESARSTSKQFIIKAGHEQTDLESIVKYDGYLIVQKFEEPPKTDGVLNDTQ
jgi:hypothetical protein